MFGIKKIYGVERETFEERFFRYVECGEPEECWIWKGPRDRWGYGRFKLGKRTRMAHRISYMLWIGKIPSGMVVRHKTCRNPLCQNPAHLLLGTHADNVRDRCEDGMSAKGSKNGRAKLNDAAVLEIRERYVGGETVTSLAREYWVDRKNIRLIVGGATWKHVPMPSAELKQAA